jgi:hypothetical protein
VIDLGLSSEIQQNEILIHYSDVCLVVLWECIMPTGSVNDSGSHGGSALQLSLRFVTFYFWVQRIMRVLAGKPSGITEMPLWHAVSFCWLIQTIYT